MPPSFLSVPPVHQAMHPKEEDAAADADVAAAAAAAAADIGLLEAKGSELCFV